MPLDDLVQKVDAKTLRTLRYTPKKDGRHQLFLTDAVHLQFSIFSISIFPLELARLILQEFFNLLISNSQYFNLRLSIHKSDASAIRWRRFRNDRG